MKECPKISKNVKKRKNNVVFKFLPPPLLSLFWGCFRLREHRQKKKKTSGREFV